MFRELGQHDAQLIYKDHAVHKYLLFILTYGNYK